MEGEAAAAVLKVLVQNLIDHSKKEISLIRGLDKEAAKLAGSLNTIQQFLNDAEMRSIPGGAVKSWLKKLEDVAFDADNVLDEFKYHLLSEQIPVFGFGGTSVSSPPINTTSSFTSGTSGIFSFGGSSSVSSSTANSVSSTSAASSVFGSGWQSQKSSGFSFSASANAAPPMASNSSSSASSGPIFSFNTASASPSQPVFGNSPIGGGFAAPPAFAFGSAAPSQNNPFMFNGQQNQVPLQSPSPFQATGSLEFNAGGSTGGYKSGRKFVKVRRTKNRKK